MHSIRSRALCAAAAFALALATGCGSHGSNVRIPKTTKVLDTATLNALASVSSNLTTFTFSATTPELDALAPGDVIVAGIHAPTLPYGTLRKVVAVDRTGPGVIVSAGDAGLTDAIEQGSFHHVLSLRSGGVLPTTASGVVPYLGPGGIVYPFNDTVLFDADGTDTPNDRVVLNGNITIEPDLGIDIDISGFSLQKATIELGASAATSINVNAMREADFPPFDKTIDTLNFPPIIFSIGPIPVVLKPSIDIVVGASGKVTAKMSTDIVVSGSAKIGLGYQNGSVGPYVGGDANGQMNVSNFDDGVKGDAKVWIGARAKASFYGIAGVYGELDFYVRAAVDSLGNPWWKLYAGAQGTVGAFAEIDFHFLFIDIHIDLFHWQIDPPLSIETLIAQADGPAPSGLLSQTDTINWARSYGGTSIEFPVTLQATADGGAILAGSAYSFSSTPTDGWILKVDRLGHVGWQLALEDLYAATSIAPAPGGGWYVVAGIVGTSPGDVYLLKLDANGTPLWAKTFSAPNGIAPHAMAAMPGGGVVIAGAADALTAADAWVARVDDAGSVLWSKTYGGTANDVANSVAVDSAGDILLAGSTQSFGISFNAIFALKLDGEGGVLWQGYYDGSGNEFGTQIAPVSTGGAILVGTNVNDALVLRLSDTGTVTWSRDVDAGTANDAADSVAVLPGPKFLALGETGLGSASNMWAFRMDANGTVEWTRSYGGAAEDAAGGYNQYGMVASACAPAAEGGYYLAGYTQSFGAGSLDVWLLRVRDNGIVDFDAGSGATGLALSNATASAGLSFTATSVVPADLALGAADLVDPRLSTGAVMAKQGGLQ